MHIYIYIYIYVSISGVRSSAPRVGTGGAQDEVIYHDMICHDVLWYTMIYHDIL